MLPGSCNFPQGAPGATVGPDIQMVDDPRLPATVLRKQTMKFVLGKPTYPSRVPPPCRIMVFSPWPIRECEARTLCPVLPGPLCTNQSLWLAALKRAEGRWDSRRVSKQLHENVIRPALEARTGFWESGGGHDRRLWERERPRASCCLACHGLLPD